MRYILGQMLLGIVQSQLLLLKYLVQNSYKLGLAKQNKFLKMSRTIHIFNFNF